MPLFISCKATDYYEGVYVFGLWIICIRVDAATRRMASRSGNITKTFPVTVQGHALLPILSTVWYIFPCFYSVVLIMVMILRAGFVLVLAQAWEDPGVGQGCRGLMPCWVGKGTDHRADSCIGPSRLTGRWR